MTEGRMAEQESECVDVPGPWLDAWPHYLSLSVAGLCASRSGFRPGPCGVKIARPGLLDTG